MPIDQTRIDSLQNARFEETACSSDTTSSYSITKCLWAGNTPHTDVVIAESPVYGKMLFTDCELQSTESDEKIYHEHLVHPLLNSLANTKDKRVLIVGGGEGATLREVLKWSPESVKEVVWIDIDQELVDLSRKYLGYAKEEVYTDPRATFYAMDVRKFLANNKDLFDAIILDLPDPDVDYLKEYPPEGDEYELYSKPFWDAVKKNLKEKGQIVTHTGPVSPGKDQEMYRAGLVWINAHANMPQSTAYHVNIPSFQSEWGFWMSQSPNHMCKFPDGAVVMDGFAQIQAFGWPRYWFQ